MLEPIYPCRCFIMQVYVFVFSCVLYSCLVVFYIRSCLEQLPGGHQATMLSCHGWHPALWLGASCDVEGNDLRLFPFPILLMFRHRTHTFTSEECFTLGELCVITSSYQYENKSRTNRVSYHMS